MKERPILMSAPMVRAILAGTKTQTRRVVKGDILSDSDGSKRRFYNPNDPSDLVVINGFLSRPREKHPLWRPKCPYGAPGDRLWARENGWQRPERTAKMMREGADTWERYYYDADGYDSDHDREQFREWGFIRRPSIHMPRWASRITLEVTRVRVERLQDISEADARAEGCRSDADTLAATGYATGRDAYQALWESINGPGSWDTNPWVWCVSFRRVT